eukprot:gene3946-15277_t
MSTNIMIEKAEQLKSDIAESQFSYKCSDIEICVSFKVYRKLWLAQRITVYREDERYSATLKEEREKYYGCSFGRLRRSGKKIHRSVSLDGRLLKKEKSESVEELPKQTVFSCKILKARANNTREIEVAKRGLNASEGSSVHCRMLLVCCDEQGTKTNLKEGPRGRTKQALLLIYGALETVCNAHASGLTRLYCELRRTSSRKENAINRERSRGFLCYNPRLELKKAVQRCIVTGLCTCTIGDVRVYSSYAGEIRVRAWIIAVGHRSQNLAQERYQSRKTHIGFRPHFGDGANNAYCVIKHRDFSVPRSRWRSGGSMAEVQQGSGVIIGVSARLEFRDGVLLYFDPGSVCAIDKVGFDDNYGYEAAHSPFAHMIPLVATSRSHTRRPYGRYREPQTRFVTGSERGVGSSDATKPNSTLAYTGICRIYLRPEASLLKTQGLVRSA